MNQSGTLAASGYSPRAAAQPPCRTYASAVATWRSAATTRPTAASAEYASPALVTRTPRRRHAARSMWSTPTDEATTSSSAGSESMSSAVTASRWLLGSPAPSPTLLGGEAGAGAGARHDCGLRWKRPKGYRPNGHDLFFRKQRTRY